MLLSRLFDRMAQGSAATATTVLHKYGSIPNINCRMLIIAAPVSTVPVCKPEVDDVDVVAPVFIPSPAPAGSVAKISPKSEAIVIR